MRDSRSVTSMGCRATSRTPSRSLRSPTTTARPIPGQHAAFEAAFGEVCVPPFEAYVGVPYADSALYASAITPTEDGWNSGDHEFICHLHERDQSMITGSQRGANR